MVRGAADDWPAVVLGLDSMMSEVRTYFTVSVLGPRDTVWRKFLCCCRPSTNQSRGRWSSSMTADQFNSGLEWVMARGQKAKRRAWVRYMRALGQRGV